MKPYPRVIPRNLFNEASLLKCIGKLVLDIHDGKINFIQFHHDDEPFNIIQHDFGHTYIANIDFWSVGGNKARLNFTRPVNSREAWPLYLETDMDSYPVFDDYGDVILTKEIVEAA